MQTKPKIYSEQRFDHLKGLDGISDDQIKEHLQLYVGYVRQAEIAPARPALERGGGAAPRQGARRRRGRPRGHDRVIAP